MMGTVGMVGRDVPAEGPMGPGKKMQAIGQQAKAAVSAARDAGAAVPKNAQGMAASGLARGADAETLFASLLTPEAPVDPAISDSMEAVPKSMAVPVQDAPPATATDGTGGDGDALVTAAREQALRAYANWMSE